MSVIPPMTLVLGVVTPIGFVVTPIGFVVTPISFILRRMRHHLLGDLHPR